MTRRRRRRSDGWVCPRCGQNGNRHGRGGARACKGNRDTGTTCPALVCECGEGVCHDYDVGWRHSPCLSAHCLHCGWSGTIRARWFERRYANARCRVSPSSWHDTIARIVPNVEPGPLVVEFVCKLCGVAGVNNVDPVDDVVWSTQKIRAPERTPEVGSSTSDENQSTTSNPKISNAHGQPAKSSVGEGSEDNDGQ